MLDIINIYQLYFFEIIPILFCFFLLFKKKYNIKNYSINKSYDFYLYVYLFCFITIFVILFTLYFDLGRIDRGTLPYAGLTFHHQQYLPFVDYGLPTGLISYFLTILFSPTISINKNCSLID